MKKSRLTPEGKQLVKFLCSRYLMTEEMALQLVQDGGYLLAVALKHLMRKY
jgi:hypothetical protein